LRGKISFHGFVATSSQLSSRLFREWGGGLNPVEGKRWDQRLCCPESQTKKLDETRTIRRASKKVDVLDGSLHSQKILQQSNISSATFFIISSTVHFPDVFSTIDLVWRSDLMAFKDNHSNF